MVKCRITDDFQLFPPRNGAVNKEMSTGRYPIKPGAGIMFRTLVETRTGENPNLRLWDYEAPWGAKPRFTPMKGRLVNCPAQGGMARIVEWKAACTFCGTGYTSFALWSSTRSEWPLRCSVCNKALDMRITDLGYSYQINVYYQNDTGQSECKECPYMTYVPAAPAKDISSCQCRPGTHSS